MVMKRFALISVVILVATCGSLFAQNKVARTFLKAVQSEGICDVKVSKAVVLASVGYDCVATDGSTHALLMETGKDYAPGDVLSIEGKCYTNGSGLKAIHCEKCVLERSNDHIPPVEFTDDVNSVTSLAGVPVPVRAEGVLAVMDSGCYIYLPDQLNNAVHARSLLLFNSSMVDRLEELESQHVIVNGYLIRKHDSDYPMATIMVADIQQPQVPIHTSICSLSSLSPGRKYKLVATITASDPENLELSDFTGSFKIPRPEGFKAATGQRAFLTVSKSGESGFSIDAMRLFPAKAFTDNLLFMSIGADGKRHVAGPMLRMDGFYEIKGVYFSNSDSFAIAEKDLSHMSYLYQAYAENSLLTLVKLFPGRQPQHIAVPDGKYDIRYFPEAESVIISESKQQDAPKADDDSVPFQIVDKKPLFNGKDVNEFSKWVNSQLVYPEEAKANGYQGRVIAQFTIEADGSVSNVRILSGVHPLIDAEVIRVISMSPKWTPGYQNERPVKVTYTYSTIFALR